MLIIKEISLCWCYYLFITRTSYIHVYIYTHITRENIKTIKQKTEKDKIRNNSGSATIKLKNLLNVY